MCKVFSPDLAHCRCSINRGYLWYYLGLPSGSNGKESFHNVGHLVLMPELVRSPGEGKGYPLQYSGLYSPWGCKDSDTTKQLSPKLHMFLSFDLAILFLEFCHEDIFPFYKNKCTRLFSNILFIVVKYWKQPKCQCIGQ